MSFKFLFFVSILSLASCSIKREATSDFRDASSVTVRKINDSVRVATGNVKLIDLQSFDSLFIDRTRVVREADSAEMAGFGINIQGLKKAYVVFEKEVRERIRQLKTHSADTLRVESSSSRRSLERDSTSHSDHQLQTVELKEEHGWFDYLLVVCLIINAAVMVPILIKNKF